MDLILETERLYLRKIKESDFSAICAILQNEAVMYAWEHTFTTDEVEAWIAENMMRYNRDGFSYWAVVEKTTNDLIGVTGIILEEVENENHTGIGYIFNNAHWHKGYAYEAASACVDYAFDTLGLNIITAQIRPINASSIRVAEKLGMKVIRPFIRKYRGKDVPHLLYGRIKNTNSESIPWRESRHYSDPAKLPGQLLAGARYREGLTQEELSKRTGIPRRHISEMENGRRPIGKSNARKIADVLNIDPRRLLNV